MGLKQFFILCSTESVLKEYLYGVQNPIFGAIIQLFVIRCLLYNGNKWSLNHAGNKCTL